jgi:hypothetical protein
MNSTDVLIAHVVKILPAVPTHLTESNYTLSTLHKYVYQSSSLPQALWVGVGVGVLLVVACCCTLCRGTGGPSHRPTDSVTYEGLPLITIKSAGRR